MKKKIECVMNGLSVCWILDFKRCDSTIDVEKEIALVGHFVFPTMGRNVVVNRQCAEIHEIEQSVT